MQIPIYPNLSVIRTHLKLPQIASTFAFYSISIYQENLRFIWSSNTLLNLIIYEEAVNDQCPLSGRCFDCVSPYTIFSMIQILTLNFQ